MTRRFVFALLVLFTCMLVAPTLLAQGVVAVAGAVPPAPTDPNEWGATAVWAFLSSSLLEWMKRQQWIGFISERTAWGVQRLMGLALAAATALGIHASFDSAAGVLTITGLLWPSVGTAIWEIVRQFVVTEITYRLAIKNYGKD